MGLQAWAWKKRGLGIYLFLNRYDAAHVSLSHRGTNWSNAQITISCTHQKACGSKRSEETDTMLPFTGGKWGGRKKRIKEVKIEIMPPGRENGVHLLKIVRWHKKHQHGHVKTLLNQSYFLSLRGWMKSWITGRVDVTNLE